MAAAIVDTGPLVAFLDRAERHHDWIRELVDELEAPLLVCEPVLVETAFLLRHLSAAQDALLRLVERHALMVAFRIADHVPALRELQRKYRDVPMSLADACVVRMAELNPRHAVLTFDSDFSVYRQHGRTPLPLIHP